MVVLSRLSLFGGLIWYPLAIVSRTIVTVGGWDEAIEIPLAVGTTWNNQITVKPSQAFSFSIWMVLFLIASYLSKGIEQIRSSSQFDNQSSSLKKILSTRSMLISLVTFVVVCYELWMLAYIYKLYVVGCAVDVQLAYSLPTFALIVNTLHQPYLLVYTGQCTNDVNKCTTFRRVIVVGACFNGILALHVLCMGITGYCTSTSISSEKYIVIALGTVELFYRIWATFRYIKLWKIHKGTIKMECPVKESGISYKAELVVTEPFTSAEYIEHCFQCSDTSHTNYTVVVR